MSLGVSVASALEEGRSGAVSGIAAEIWGAVAARGVARPLTYPGDACIVAVGGATLGGSGKTPVAVACARWLAERGVRVALIGHAYGARPERARITAFDDRAEVVGDEALDAARALAGLPVTVVVAPTRQAALDYGLRYASVAILDGVAQCRPRRATLSLLTVAGDRPWGAGRCPPRGDLRAPSDALIAACDRVVVVGQSGDSASFPRPTDWARMMTSGVDLPGSRLGWADVAALRIGLCTAIARPGRVVDLLARKGVLPRAVVRLADHASPKATHGVSTARAIAEGVRRGLDLWLCTSKCSVHLPPTLGGVPVATIAVALSLPASLTRALAAGVDVLRKRP